MIYHYFLLGMFMFLLIFTFAIGLEKTLKIIIGNYLLIAIILACNVGINLLEKNLSKNWLPFLQNIEQIKAFLIDNKIFILLGIYFIFLIIIFAKSNINVWWKKSKFVRVLLSLIFAPLAVISIMVTLEVAILGIKIFSVEWLYTLADQFGVNQIMYYFIILTPVWLILPWLMTIIFSLKIPKPKLNLSSWSKEEKEQVEGQQKEEKIE